VRAKQAIFSGVLQHLNESPVKFRESTNSAKGRKFFNGFLLGDVADF